MGQDRTSQVALVVKNLPANAGDTRDMDSFPGSGRSPRVGNGNPLQYPCLENSMDRRAWQATVHRVAKSWTRLKHTRRLLSTRLLCPWDFPGKDTGVGCHFLLQGIFPTQGSNWVSCITGRFFYRLSHQGSPIPGWCWPHRVSSSGFTHSRRLSTVGHAILAALAGLISY